MPETTMRSRPRSRHRTRIIMRRYLTGRSHRTTRWQSMAYGREKSGRQAFKSDLGRPKVRRPEKSLWISPKGAESKNSLFPPSGCKIRPKHRKSQSFWGLTVLSPNSSSKPLDDSKRIYDQMLAVFIYKRETDCVRK